MSANTSIEWTDGTVSANQHADWSAAMREARRTGFPYWNLPNGFARPASWVRIDRAEQAPVEPGCYAVYFDGELVYVGSSRNLRTRVRRCFTSDRVYLKVKASRRMGDWLMREWRLIRRLQPRDNKVGVSA